MKRLSILLCLIMLMQSAAFASGSSIAYDTVDSENDVISITGNGTPGGFITVIMLNPGYTFDDFASGSDGAAAYVGYTYADAQSGEYSSEPVKMVSGGSFKVFAAGEEGSFDYYPKAVKEAAITKFINSEIDYKTLVATFGLDTNSLYAANSDGCLERFENAYFKTAVSTATLDEAKNLMQDAFLLSAFDDNKTDLIFSGNEIIHKSELGITSGSADEYADYLANLNATGVSNVKTGLVNGVSGCNTPLEVKDVFNELLYVNLIMNNKEKGYGHVQGVFEKYSSAFSGVNYPSSADKDMYRSLLTSGSDTMAEIEDFINNYVPSSQGGSGGGGGASSLSPGSGFGGGTSNPSVPTTPNVPVTPPAGNGSYSDLPDNHWASGAFEALSRQNVINGYSDGTVKPEAEVTRAEFAKMLVCLLGLDITDTDTGFLDVSSADWSASYITAAVKAGLIMGNNGSFNPTAVISRQDAAIILARAAGLKSSVESTFTDNDQIADYAKDAAAAVQEAGLMQGTGDGSFSPYGSMTRAQAAMVLFRLSEKGAK